MTTRAELILTDNGKLANQIARLQKIVVQNCSGRTRFQAIVPCFGN